MMDTIPFASESNKNNTPERSKKFLIDKNNWKEEWPYEPMVILYAWHTGEHLLLEFEVEEEFIAAIAQQDNDKVSKDSCVEFFISFDDNGYYNIEANCIGKVLMSHRKGRKIDVVYAPQEVLQQIKRTSSLGEKPFSCVKSDGKWKLRLEIPVTAFFNHSLNSFHGVDARCNIYKCGDNLPRPHFLSWQPILTDTPDFHRPDFFHPISFE